MLPLWQFCARNSSAGLVCCRLLYTTCKTSRGDGELGTKRPLWFKNQLNIKESQWGDLIHAAQFRELLPAILADGVVDLKFLAANQRELGRNLC